MANPAELLHRILSDWMHNDPAKQIYVLRGINSEEALMHKHRRAIILIEEIDQIVAGMDLTDSRRKSVQRNLAKWTKWVFAYPHNWLAQPDTNYPNLRDHDALDALDLVAQLLDGQVPKVDEETRGSYLSTINEIVAALASDDSLPAELKKHVYSVAAHARQCVEEYELTGDFALQAAVERLAAVVQSAMVVSKKSEAWQNFRDKFFYPTVTGILASAPQLAIATVGGS